MLRLAASPGGPFDGGHLREASHDGFGWFHHWRWWSSGSGSFIGHGGYRLSVVISELDGSLNVVGDVNKREGGCSRRFVTACRRQVLSFLLIRQLGKRRSDSTAWEASIGCVRRVAGAWVKPWKRELVRLLELGLGLVNQL